MLRFLSSKCMRSFKAAQKTSVTKVTFCFQSINQFWTCFSKVEIQLHLYVSTDGRILLVIFSRCGNCQISAVFTRFCHRFLFYSFKFILSSYIRFHILLSGLFKNVLTGISLLDMRANLNKRQNTRKVRSQFYCIVGGVVVNFNFFLRGGRK